MRWGRSARAGVRADLSLQAGRARLRQQFSIGPARAGPTRESALAIAGASAPPPAISESTCVHSIATKDGSCMHAYTLSLSGSSYELLWTSRKPTVSYNERYHLQSTEGDLEFWSRPCGDSLLLCWKKCACLGPSRRRSPRRPALSIARANCSMTLVGGTDSRCERRRSCQCASTTKW